MSVSRESKEQARMCTSSASDGRILSHNLYQLLDYLGAFFSGRLNSIIRMNFTISNKRCFSSSLAKSRKRRCT